MLLGESVLLAMLMCAESLIGCSWGRKVDLFAFGCLLFRLYVGRELLSDTRAGVRPKTYLHTIDRTLGMSSLRRVRQRGSNLSDHDGVTMSECLGIGRKDVACRVAHAVCRSGSWRSFHSAAAVELSSGVVSTQVTRTLSGETPDRRHRSPASLHAFTTTA